MSLSRSLLTRLLALAVSVAVPALANADDEMPTADASNVPALVVRAQSQAKQAHATAHADASQSQAMLDRKVEAKQEAIDGTKAKIEAERDAAAEQFAVAVAAAAAATAAVGIQPSTCVGADDTLTPAIAQATSAAGDEAAVAAVGEHRARVLVERAVRSVSVVLSPPSGGTSPDTHRRSDQRWTTKISRGF